MICEKCKASGQRSTVTGGMSSSTLMYCSPWYDEDGKYHSHDMNWRTTSYQCSNGHRWSVHEQGSCPAGDWVGGREVVWHTPPSSSTAPTAGAGELG